MNPTKEAMGRLEHMTGASSSAGQRAIAALQAAGYHVETRTEYGERGQKATLQAAYCDDLLVGTAQTIWWAWCIAAEHALRERSDRLPAPYQESGRAWPMPGEKRT